MTPAPCTPNEAKGRLAKAEQFFDAAETIRQFADHESDVGDAYVTLCVHAGIAAADAICCHELQQHAQGQNHNDAVQLIRQVKPDGKQLGAALARLLKYKTRAGYSAIPVNADMRKQSREAATKLLTAANDRL